MRDDGVFGVINDPKRFNAVLILIQILFEVFYEVLRRLFGESGIDHFIRILFRINDIPTLHLQ